MTDNEKQWSDGLRQATREALNELIIAPTPEVWLKNTDGRSGTIAMDELLKGNLKMIDCESRHVTVFTNVDELIRAGWAID